MNDPIVIEVDAFKEKIAEYDPKKPEAVHTQSARLADQAFMDALKNSHHLIVILMCGGSASGKSEFASSQLSDTHAIIFDSTLSTVKGAKIKIRNSQKAKKKVQVYAIIPDDLSRAFAAFLERERKVPPRVFFETHSGSRKTLLWICKNKPSVEINLFESTTKRDKLSMRRLQFDSRDGFKGYLESIQLTLGEVEALTLP